MLVLLFVFIGVSFLLLFVGTSMAPFAANRKKLEERKMGKFFILQLPHLFMRSWYEPDKLLAWQLCVYGALGVVIGFSALFVLAKLGIG